MGLFRKPPPLERHRRPPAAADRPAPSLSYYSRRSEETLNTGRNQKREAIKRSTGNFARYWVRRFGLAILLIVAVVCLIDVLSLSTDSQVIPVTTNAFIHSRATYQAAADKLLAASLWNHNKITIDTAKVSSQLQNQFPELASVNITLPLLSHRPIIYIQPTEPALILISSEGSFVVGADGKTLTAATDDATITRLHLPVVTDQSGLQPTLHSQVLTSNDVSFIQTIVAQLAGRQITVGAMTLPPANRELDVQLTGQPYIVKFNLQSGDARQQAGTFLAAQANLQSQHIVPASYIDARVDGRVYYK